MSKQMIHVRTESHSDVAESAPAKAYQAQLTERKFSEQLVKRLRDHPDGLILRNLQEEWVTGGDSLVYELRVEAEPVG